MTDHPIDNPEYDRHQDGSFFGNYYTTNKDDNPKEEDSE
jgi:hypothetical protein